MYKIEIDSSKNYLKIHLEGDFDIRQGNSLIEELKLSINMLKPGFKLLTDLSKLRNMQIESHNCIDEVMDLCNLHKVSKVIRVIAKDTRDIGFNIMSLFHYSHSVIICTCESLDEANKEIEAI